MTTRPATRPAIRSPDRPVARPAAQPLLWCKPCGTRHLPPVPQPYRCRRCGLCGWREDTCAACGAPVLITPITAPARRPA